MVSDKESKDYSWVLVVHICHPKLHRRLRWGGLQFHANLGKKKVFKTPSQQQQQKSGHGGIHLPSQQGRKLKIGGS
jgi:hypothetical protein